MALNELEATDKARAAQVRTHRKELDRQITEYVAMRGLDTRRLQVYLGHRSILSTVAYTDLAMHATDSVWDRLA